MCGLQQTELNDWKDKYVYPCSGFAVLMHMVIWQGNPNAWGTLNLPYSTSHKGHRQELRHPDTIQTSATILGTPAGQLCIVAWRRSGRGSWQHRMKQVIILTQLSLPELYLTVHGARAKFHWIKSLKLD